LSDASFDDSATELSVASPIPMESPISLGAALSADAA